MDIIFQKKSTVYPEMTNFDVLQVRLFSLHAIYPEILKFFININKFNFFVEKVEEKLEENNLYEKFKEIFKVSFNNLKIK
jgi:hypothetical protein